MILALEKLKRQRRENEKHKDGKHLTQLRKQCKDEVNGLLLAKDQTESFLFRRMTSVRKSLLSVWRQHKRIALKRKSFVKTSEDEENERATSFSGQQAC